MCKTFFTIREEEWSCDYVGQKGFLFFLLPCAPSGGNKQDTNVAGGGERGDDFALLLHFVAPRGNKNK